MNIEYIHIQTANRIRRHAKTRDPRDPGSRKSFEECGKFLARITRFCAEICHIIHNLCFNSSTAADAIC